MATPPQYFVVEQPTQNITIVNKSKFITTLAPIKSWNDAQELYKQICKKYSDATHNCYACIFDTLGNSLKFGDDGEPQGTAGQPMLEVLKKKNIRMTLAVVTRYFGGIKLGAGGLVSAYSAAIAEALSKANILSQQWSQVVEIQCCYELFDCVKKVIESQFGLIDNVDYGDCIILRVAIKIDKLDSFVKDIDDCTLGKTLVKKCVEQYCSFLNDK